MPTKSQLAQALIVSVAYNVIETRISRRKYKKLNEAFERLYLAYEIDVDDYNALAHEFNYLVHLLNEHEISLSEFDRIALPHVKVVEE